MVVDDGSCLSGVSLIVEGLIFIWQQDDTHSLRYIFLSVSDGMPWLKLMEIMLTEVKSNP